MLRSDAKKIHTHVTGFSLVEAVLSVGVFSLLILAVASGIIYGRESFLLSGARVRANFLAEEGLEATRDIRDAAFSNLSNGNKGLAESGGQWTFSGTNDQIDIFQRQINISTVDSKRKKVVATVTWPQNAVRNGSVVLTTYLTNWLATVSGIGDWTNPNTQAGFMDLSGTQDGLKIAYSANYAYIIRNGGTPNFVIVDVTTPATPVLKGTLTLAGTPQNIFLDGNYAYVASTNNSTELQIINVSNKSLPTLATSYDASGNADGRGIFVSSGKAYLTRNGGSGNEFLILNVSNPLTPTLLGSAALGQTAYDTVVLGNYAYVVGASNQPELRVVDVTNPASPSVVGSLNLANNVDVTCVAGFGSTLLLGRNDNYLYSVDVTTPAAPLQKGSFNALGVVKDISIGNSNTYAFIATASATSELQVIDISNLTSLSLVGSFDAAGILNGIVYDGTVDRAFAVGSADAQELLIVQP